MATVGEELARATRNLVTRAAELLPDFLGALLLLAVGWLVALLLGALARRLVVMLDVVVARVVGQRFAGRVRPARSARVIGTIVFWIVLIAFVGAAAQVLGLEAFSVFLGRVIEYLPAFAAGLVIVVAGYIVSRLVADVILRTRGPLAPGQRLVAARAAQASILAAALLVGAEQIGIRVTLLAIFVGVVAVAVVGGVVVSISLGARVHVANLIGVQQMRRQLALGQRIRIAGFEGRILEFSPHAIVLETRDGRVALPGRMFSEAAVELLGRAEGDG